jgi:DNA-binding transcriptional ArsR family regulator
VLQALAAAADGRLATANVRRRVERPGASDSVTRASVSRTLRRLWRAGLVELADGDRKTLTAEADRLQHLSDVVHAHPEAAYRAYQERRRAKGQRDGYGSAAQYAAAWRDAAQRIPAPHNTESAEDVLITHAASWGDTGFLLGLAVGMQLGPHAFDGGAK